MSTWCSALPGGIRLILKVLPNAKRSAVVALTDDVLKIRLHAPPVDGKANQALIRFIADTLKVPTSAVTITHGQFNKRKILEVRSNQLTAETAMHVLVPPDQSR